LVNRLAIVSCVALILGALAGMPVLIRTVTTAERPRLYVDVVYASFSLLPSNQSIPKIQNGQLISFLFVLNVTNLANESVKVTSAHAIAAGDIQFASEGQNNYSYFSNQTITNWPPSIVESWNNITQVRWPNPGVAYGYSYAIAECSENFAGDEYKWVENASGLVALSGMVDLSETSLALLRSTKLFVFSHVEGEAYGSDVLASGAYVIKGVQLEKIGDSEFVFNELLNIDQTLQFQHDGTGVSIVSGK
jgi:hypothetical protein